MGLIYLVGYNAETIAVCDSKENTIKFINENFNVNLQSERDALENLNFYVILNKVARKDNPEVNLQLYITQIQFNTYIE